VLDLNVFWDVVQRRPRREFAAQVLAAAFDNLIKVLVTQEFINELERTTKVANDPALEFALQLLFCRSPYPCFRHSSMRDCFDPIPGTGC